MSTRSAKSRKPSKHVNKSDYSHVVLNERQKELVKTIKENQIIFVHGPAGSSKTFATCYAALDAFVKDECKKIILSKPYVESGEKLGFLPGTVDEKTEPYIESYKHNFTKLLKNEQTFGFLKSVGVIDFKPLAYMRGVTFDDSFMIIDEAQNATMKQLILFITRMGKNSKVILMGDVSQHDIKSKMVALPTMANLFKNIKGVAEFKLTSKDVVRNELLIKITDTYDKWKYSDDAKKSGLDY